MKKIHRIVITGGPCGGKTELMKTLSKDLKARGYQIFIVPETFTEMYGGGIYLKDFSVLDFQDMLFRMQLSKEHTYNEAALRSKSNKIAIFYDRGAVDGLAYMSKIDAEKVLLNNNATLNALFSHYDAVIHMITAADGALEAYLKNKENNPARYETPEEAIAVDNALKQAWRRHPKLRIIDNSTDFPAKISRTMAEIYDILGDSAPLE